MKSLFKTAVISLTIAAAAIGSTAPAFAGGWGPYGPPPRHHRDRGGEAAALGVIGLATGLIVGSAIAEGNNRSNRVYEPYPADPYRRAPAPPPAAYYDGEDDGYYPEAPRRYQSRVTPVRQSFEPWTQSWYDYCADRYRSFDARTGTYMGYDGARHFCTAG